MIAACFPVGFASCMAGRGIVFTVVISLNMPPIVMAEDSEKQYPVKLFAEFEAGWKARDYSKASSVADKLIRLRDGARPIIPELLKFIKDLPNGKELDGTEFSYRSDAAKVLASIGAPAAIPLAEMIAEGDAKVSKTTETWVVPKGTTVIGSKSYTANDVELVPTSVSCSIFETITEAFDYLAFEAAPAVPKLVDLLDSSSLEVRAEACRCLGPIGPPANAALQRIRELCNDPDAKCRKLALRALARIEADTAQLMPFLANGLADKSTTVRSEALKIIPAIGTTATPLSDQLVALLIQADLAPEELRGAEERLFAPRMSDLEVGQIIEALQTVNLQNEKQCDVIADLLIRGKGRINADILAAISTLLVEASAMAHPAIERWVSKTKDADSETQVAALCVAFSVKPPLEKSAPENIDRAIALSRKIIPQRPGAYIDELREVPPLERAAQTLVRKIPEIGPAAVTHFWNLAQHDEAYWSLAVGIFYQTEGADLTMALDWLIARLGDTKFEHRWLVAECLGKMGSKAATAVPALESVVNGFEYSQYNQHQDMVHLVESCYETLVRITGDGDRWVKHSEDRLLRLMLQEQPRQVSAIGGYFAMIHDMGASAFPSLCRWMGDNDAVLAAQAMDCHPRTASVMLPELLKNRKNFDANQHHRFADFVAHADPTVAAGATDILIECLETYRRQSADPSEQEKLQRSPWSRYSSSSENSILDLLHAFRVIGRAEARKIVPVLLALYDEGPIKGKPCSWETAVRAQILDTLISLGADVRAQAGKWVPVLLHLLETEFEVAGNLFELRAYGPLASSALPDLLCYARLRYTYCDEALEALGRIAPNDSRVMSLRHVAKFRRD